MSEFPEIQPFGPRPPQAKESSPGEEKAVTTSQPETNPVAAVPRSGVSVTVVVTAATVGFALGYLVCRYQNSTVSQSKIDEFINYAQGWIREQGPKITDPIRQGLESTGSTVEQALKKVGASHTLESLNPFQRPKPRKFLGFEIF